MVVTNALSLIQATVEPGVGRLRLCTIEFTLNSGREPEHDETEQEKESREWREHDSATAMIKELVAVFKANHVDVSATGPEGDDDVWKADFQVKAVHPGTRVTALVASIDKLYKTWAGRAFHDDRYTEHKINVAKLTHDLTHGTQHYVTATVEAGAVDYKAMITAYLKQHCLPSELNHMDADVLADVKSRLTKNFRSIKALPKLAAALVSTGDFSHANSGVWQYIGDRIGNAPLSYSLFMRYQDGVHQDTIDSKLGDEVRKQIHALAWPFYVPGHGWRYEAHPGISVTATVEPGNSVPWAEELENTAERMNNDNVAYEKTMGTEPCVWVQVQEGGYAEMTVRKGRDQAMISVTVGDDSRTSVKALVARNTPAVKSAISRFSNGRYCEEVLQALRNLACESESPWGQRSVVDRASLQKLKAILKV